MKPENDKLSEILQSLDGVKRATAPDFFYTRLKARMEREHEVVTKRPWILRPAFAMITLVLVLLVNAAVILQKDNEETSVQETDALQLMASEYSLNDNGILYDLSSEQ